VTPARIHEPVALNAGTLFGVYDMGSVATILKEATRDVARAEKRNGLRLAELRTEAAEWLRAIVESLDLVLVIRGTDPTG
jgi:hypothetical protein